MRKIDLSFCIPLYNCEEFISELISCFKDDVDFTYEIIVADDGSTDNSYKILMDNNNPHLRVFKKENSGVSDTRNFLIDKAVGKWITFIDSDDLIDFDMYADAFRKTKNNYIDYLINVDSDKMYLKLLNSNNKLNFMIENEIINSPCSKFYRLDILKSKNIYFNNDYSLGEDLIFNLEYYIMCKNIDYSCYKMYIYRDVNPLSLTSKYRENKFEELMSVNEKCKSLFLNNISILDSLEFIRIKNCISCLKSEVVFAKKDKNALNKYVTKMKKYKKIKFVKLNDFVHYFIYYLWYFIPNFILLYLVKLYFKV